jgi:hypothetical protein
MTRHGRSRGGHLIVVERELPVVYESWAHWRRERAEHMDFLVQELPTATTEFCAVCWGNGRILSPAANGEGNVPVTCGHCDGRGSILV